MASGQPHCCPLLFTIIVNNNIHPDSAKLDLIGRMGGDWYTRTTERFEVERP